jgi:hypothetical protein
VLNSIGFRSEPRFFDNLSGGVVLRALRISAAALVAALAITASAQEGLRDRDPNFDATKQIANDLTQSTFHYGAFYLLSRFQLSDLGYSQEIFLPVATTPQGLSFSVSAPQRLYIIPRKKVVLSAEATPTYSLVNQNGSHNQVGWLTRGDAQFLFNHLYLDVYASAFKDLRAPNAEIARVVTQRNREAGVKSEVKYSSRTSLFLSAARTTISFPTDSGTFQPVDVALELPLLDRSENRYRASFAHKTFPVTSLFLASEVDEYKFTTDVTRNARRTYAGAGFNFGNGRTTWRLEAGPAKLNFRNPAVRDYSGALVTTSADHAFGPRIRLTAAAARDVDFSLYGPNGYYILDRVQVIAEYAASRRLTLRALSQGGRDLYDASFAGLRRRDNFTFNGIGWMYTVRRLHAGFDVGYLRRSTNVAEGDREHGIRVLLHLSFTP